MSVGQDIQTSRPAAAVRQPFISFARGISILTIVLYHFIQYVPLPPLLAKANLLGGAGIYIFLFASSYGLSFSRVSSWKDFYWKRFQRVLIPYYLSITLIFLLNQLVHVYPEGWAAYFSHILLYKMFVERYMQSFGPHFWFISTIIQFYLLWPALLFVAARFSTKGLLLLAFGLSIAYSLLTFWLGVQNERIWYSSAIQYTWVFVLGLAAARQQWVPILLRLNWRRYVLLAGVGLGFTLLISRYLGAAGNSFNDYFMFVAYFSACMLLFFLSQQLPVLLRFVLWIESFSYSFYLVHFFLFELYLKFFATTRIHLYEVPVITAICLVAALGFEKVVNQLLSLTTGAPRTLPTT